MDFLKANAINFECHNHPPVATCEEARTHLANAPGMATKNLFLRNKKGDKHLLVSVPEVKQVDLSALSALLGIGRLSFGSAQRLYNCLGVNPGAVTLLAIINDKPKAVDLIIDEDVWSAASVQCHPLVNTQTLVLEQPALRRFLELLGRSASVMRVPEA